MTPTLEPNKPPAIDVELAAQLEQYKGQFVAVDESRKVVVGSGATAQEAVAAAAKAGFTDPLVFRVLTHTRRVRMR